MKADSNNLMIYAGVSACNYENNINQCLDWVIKDSIGVFPENIIVGEENIYEATEKVNVNAAIKAISEKNIYYRTPRHKRGAFVLYESRICEIMSG